MPNPYLDMGSCYYCDLKYCDIELDDICEEGLVRGYKTCGQCSFSRKQDYTMVTQNPDQKQFISPGGPNGQTGKTRR